MNIPISKQNSTTSLDSLFSRLDLATTISTTPVDAAPELLPNAAAVSNLIQQKIQSKTLVLLVGLPASGKSTVCKQLAEFLRANNFKLLIYNAGNIRRMMTTLFLDLEFFNPDNTAAAQQREVFARMCMDNMLEDFRANRINVGFLDATNTTAARRASMLRIVRESGVEFANIVVLDISCSDKALATYNITSKAFNVDYKGRDIAASIADFSRRTEHYFRVYEPVTDAEFALYGDAAYIRIENGGRKVYAKGETKDVAGQLISSFTANYYKLHGERYNAAAKSFHDMAAEGK